MQRQKCELCGLQLGKVGNGSWGQNLLDPIGRYRVYTLGEQIPFLLPRDKAARRVDREHLVTLLSQSTDDGQAAGQGNFPLGSSPAHQHGNPHPFSLIRRFLVDFLPIAPGGTAFWPPLRG